MRFLSTFLFFCGILFASPAFSQTVKIEKPTPEKLRADSLKKVHQIKLAEARHFLDSLQKTSLSPKTQAKERLKTIYGLYAQESNYLKKELKKDFFKIRQADVAFTQQFGSREGESPIQLPVSYTRLQSNLGVDILGIPLQINQFWTSGQVEIMQPMNRFSVGFDLQAQQKKIRQYADSRIESIKKQIMPYQLENLEKLKNIETELGDVEKLKQTLTQYKSIDSLTKTDAGKMLKAQAEKQAKRQASEQLAKNKGKVEDKLSSNKITKMVYDEAKKGNLKNKKALQDALIAKSKDSLSRAKNNITDISKKKQDSISTKLKDTLSAHQQKLSKFLQQNKMTAQDLEHLVRWRDSLTKINAEQILQFETISSLRELKNGNLSDNLGRLQKIGFLSKTVVFLSKIRQFKAGTTNPVYSSLVMQGLPINGFHVEYETNKLYGAVSAGKTIPANPILRQLKREIYAGSVGIGSKDKNHVHIHVLKGKDDTQQFRGDSLLQGFGDTLFYSNPRAGLVVATDFKWEWNKKLSAKVELARSLTNMNTLENAQFWIPTTQDNFRQGWAAIADIKGTLYQGAQIQGKARYISPDYYSLGLPYLRNDLQGADVNFTQAFWKGKVIAKPFLAHWQDNVQKQGNATTFLTRYGGSLLVKAKNVPQFTLAYQANDILRENNVERVEVWQGQTQYAYGWGKWQFSTEFQLAYNKRPTMFNEAQLANFGIQTNQWSIAQSITTGDRWNVRASIGKTSAQNFINSLQNAQGNDNPIWVASKQTGRWMQYQVEGDYTFFGIWQNQLSFIYLTQEGGGGRQGVQMVSRLQWDRLVFSASYSHQKVNMGAGFNYTERLGNVGLGWKF